MSNFIATNENPTDNHADKVRKSVDYNHPAEQAYRDGRANAAAKQAAEIEYDRREVIDSEGTTYVIEDREDAPYVIATQAGDDPIRSFGSEGLRLDTMPEQIEEETFLQRVDRMAGPPFLTALETTEGAMRGIGLGLTKFATNVLRAGVDNPVGDLVIGEENVQAFEDFTTEFLENAERLSRQSGIMDKKALGFESAEFGTSGQVANNIGDVAGQFVAPAGALYKAFRAMGAAPLLSSVLADGSVGFFGVAPEDENVANLIPEDSEAFGALRELFATDPDASEFENRAKNAVEAMVLLGIGEAAGRMLVNGIQTGSRALKNIKLPKNFTDIFDRNAVIAMGSGAAGEAILNPREAQAAEEARAVHENPVVVAWANRHRFTELEDTNGLPNGLLSAVMWTESKGDPNAVSPAGAQGLFQFMPATAEGRGVDPTDTQSSSTGAAEYLGELLQKYDGDLDKALGAYNWGQGNVDRKGLGKAPAETKNYIEKVKGLLGVEVTAANGDLGFQLLAEQMNPNFRLAGGKTELLKKAGKLIAKKGDPIMPEETATQLREALKNTGEAQGIDFNLSRMETPNQLNNLIDEISEVYKEPISKRKGGVQTFTDTQAKADLSRMTGFDVEEVLSRQSGELWPAHKIKAARDIFVSELQKTEDLARTIKAGENTSENLVAFRRQLAVVSAVQSQIKGVQTETARALSQYRMTAKTPMEVQVNLSEMIQKSGGADVNETMVDAYLNVIENGGADAGATFARNADQVTGLDMLYEAWINSLLGSPTTHAVNMLGNTLTINQAVVERYAAASYGAVERNVGRAFGKEAGGVTFAEAQAFAQGSAMSTVDAMKMMAKAFKTGESSDLFGKIDYHGRAITTQNINELPLAKTITSKMMQGDELIQTNSQLAHMIDFMGEYYYRLPGRFLMSEDELFKVINYRGEIHALAAREANEMGLDKAARTKRLNEILEDPQLNAPDMHQKALEFAREQTFTTPPGPVASKIQGALSAAPGGRVVVPFFGVINNITKYVAGRVPGAALLTPTDKIFNPKTRQMLFSKDPAERQLVMGRWATGGSLLGFGAWAGTNGVITGRISDNPRMVKQIEETTGRKRYSMILPGTDRMAQYNRLEPMGMLMAIAADTANAMAYVDNEEERQNLALLATAAVVPYMEDKSFFSGVTQFMDAINPTFADDQSRGKALGRYLSNLAATAPGAVMGPLAPGTPLSRNIKSNIAMDRAKRLTEANNWTIEKDQYGDDILIANSQSYQLWERTLNKIYAATPGLSETLPSQVNIWGDEIHYEGGLGPDIATPIYASTPSFDVKDLKGFNFPKQIEVGRFRGVEVGPDITVEQHRKFVDVVGIDGELERLNMPLSMPRREISARVNGKVVGSAVKLNPEDHIDLVKIMNNIRVPNEAHAERKRMNLKETLNWMIKEPEYAMLPEDIDATNAKGDMIRRVYNQYKGAAIELFFQNHPRGQAYYRRSIETKMKAQNTGVQ